MNEKQENKMGVLPIKKLILTMSLPMMISMLVQALYNIVDSIFVAQINQEALTALSASFPMQLLATAFATGTGVGVNAFLSRSLGEKDYKKANKVANNSIFIAMCIYILFMLIGIFATKPYFMLMSEQEDIISYGVTYLSICLVGSLGMYGQFAFEKLLQSTGKTFYTMITQGVGAIINIILDPILIFGWFGFPEMGVAGAAIATIAGQYVAAILAIYFNQKFNNEIKLSIKEIFKPELKIIKGIFQVGIPSIIMTSVASVMNFGLNIILFSLNPDGTSAAVFGIYYKLQSFIYMPVFGLNNGMVPILAYNFGAGYTDRMKQTIKYSLIYAISIMLFGLLVIQIFPVQLLQLFNAKPELIEMGVTALRLITTSFIFAGFCIVSLSVFQALNHAFFSLFVAIIRQVVVLLPVAFLLSLTGDVNLVWLAFPIAEIFSVTISVIFMIKIFKKLKL